jgi:hypothetical protein
MLQTKLQKSNRILVILLYVHISKEFLTYFSIGIFMPFMLLSTAGLIPQGENDMGVKLIAHLHLMLR